MTYPVKKKDVVLDGALQAISDNRPSLASQHLQYCVVMENNRAALTQHAMSNTAILMNVAGQIVDENPSSAGALRTIMESYLTATGETIRGYGVPDKYR